MAAVMLGQIDIALWISLVILHRLAPPVSPFHDRVGCHAPPRFGKAHLVGAAAFHATRINGVYPIRDAPKILITDVPLTERCTIVWKSGALRAAPNRRRNWRIRIRLAGRQRIESDIPQAIGQYDIDVQL